MSTVYLVDGTIDDTMQGIPFTLGIFTDLDLARAAVKEFIGHNDYKVSCDSFSVPTGKGQLSYPGPQFYDIRIIPFSLNKTRIPKEFVGSAISFS